MNQSDQTQTQHCHRKPTSKFLMLFFQLVQTVVAQSCKPDLLVDDFRRANQSLLIIESPPPLRYFNLLGGDYGSKAANFSYNPEPISNMDIIAEQGEPDTSERQFSPGYVKFDLNACFDLNGYASMDFDIESPPGSDFYIALTQKTSDCSARSTDSVYTKLSQYVVPDGTKKTAVVPFADFAKNLVGGDFNMRYLKDITFVNLVPAGCRNATATTTIVGSATGTPVGSVPPAQSTRSSGYRDAPLALLLLLGALL